MGDIRSRVCGTRTDLGTLVSLKFLFALVNQSLVFHWFVPLADHNYVGFVIPKHYPHRVHLDFNPTVTRANPNMTNGYEITQSKILLLFFDGLSVIFSHICTPEMDLSITGLFISRKSKHTMYTPDTLAIPFGRD